MSDVECPYCGADIEICHDDGFGMEEDEIHQYECPKCEKNFVFTTCISLTYWARKADCLNGEDHDFAVRPRFPAYMDRKVCRYCGHEELGKYNENWRETNERVLGESK